MHVNLLAKEQFLLRQNGDATGCSPTCSSTAHVLLPDTHHSWKKTTQCLMRTNARHFHSIIFVNFHFHFTSATTAVLSSSWVCWLQSCGVTWTAFKLCQWTCQLLCMDRYSCVCCQSRSQTTVLARLHLIITTDRFHKANSIHKFVSAGFNLESCVGKLSTLWSKFQLHSSWSQTFGWTTHQLLSPY